MPILFRFLFMQSFLYMLTTIVALLAIFSILEVFDKSKFIGEDFHYGLMAEYIILKIPFLVSEFLPIVILISSSMMLAGLATNRETIAMRTAGLGLHKILIPVMALGVIGMLICLFASEWFSPITMKRVDHIDNNIIHHRNIEQSSQKWYKEDLNFWKIEALGDALFKTLIIRVDQDGKWQQRIEAVGQYNNGTWHLRDVYMSKPNEGGIDQKFLPSLQLKSAIGPSSTTPANPRHMTIMELYEYNQTLKKSGLASARYELALHRKISTIISCLVMALLALALRGNDHQRDARIQGIALAIVLGSVYYVLSNASGLLGTGESIPPIFAAWLPSIFFFGLAGFLLLQREEY